MMKEEKFMKILIENIQMKIDFEKDLNELIEKAVGFSLESEDFPLEPEISFILCDDEKIRELNKNHREIDAPTDVLSFPMLEYIDGIAQAEDYDFDMSEDLLMLGDIVISLETATRQADEYGHSLEREIAFLATHGIFHLLGYDHETKEEESIMLGKQESVLEKLGLTR